MAKLSKIDLAIFVIFCLLTFNLGLFIIDMNRKLNEKDNPMKVIHHFEQCVTNKSINLDEEKSVFSCSVNKRLFRKPKLLFKRTNIINFGDYYQNTYVSNKNNNFDIELTWKKYIPNSFNYQPLSNFFIGDCINGKIFIIDYAKFIVDKRDNNITYFTNDGKFFSVDLVYYAEESLLKLLNQHFNRW